MLWESQHKDVADQAVKSGSIVLNQSPLPGEEPNILSVKPADDSGSGGSVQGLSLGGARPTSAPVANAGTQGPIVPTKAEFEQYEALKNEKAAFFAELRVGDGAEVKAGSKAAVLYRGWLTDGTIFDDSYDKKVAFEFEEGAHRVIPGWEQALFGMKVGGKRRIIVPPAAGYGPSGQGPIPPNAVLVFDVELVQVRD